MKSGQLTKDDLAYAKVFGVLVTEDEQPENGDSSVSASVSSDDDSGDQYTHDRSKMKHVSCARPRDESRESRKVRYLTYWEVNVLWEFSALLYDIIPLHIKYLHPFAVLARKK